MALKATPLNVSVSQQVYEELLEENKIIKQFISDCTSAEIQRYRELEKDNCVLRAQLSEKEKQIKEIKEQTEKRIKSIEILKDREIEYVKKEAVKKKENNLQYNKIRPLEKEKQTVTEERDRLKEMYDSLKEDNKTLLEINESQLSLIGEILEIVKRVETKIENGSSVEEIKESIKEINTTVRQRKKTKEELDEEYKQIIDLLNEGKSQKEIGNLLYSHQTEKSRESTISRIMKRDRFKKLASELLK